MDLSGRMAHYRVPGVSIAVIDKFEIEWAKGYGVLAADAEFPVSPQTLFQAASLGKLAVAVAALQQVETGALSLDRDVNEDLRSWKLPDNEFTVVEKATLRRLLSHCAGVTVSAVLVAYPQRGQGVVIMTNSDSGDALWREVLNAVSVEYEWVPDYTYFYVCAAVAIIAAMLGFLALRRRKRMCLLQKV
jgi:CubicO group peptidase (beta-lactamase class C family)